MPVPVPVSDPMAGLSVAEQVKIQLEKAEEERKKKIREEKERKEAAEKEMKKALEEAMKKRDEKKAAEKEDGDESNKEDEGKDDQDGEKKEEDPLKDVDLDDSDFSPSTYDELMTLRLNNKEKPRPHRKTHGKIGFQTLAKLIASRWKALGDDRRDHYKSLAAIDMDNYKEKTHEYQKKKMKNSAGEAIATGESSV